MDNHSREKLNSFTLLETLVVIGVFLLVALVLIPFSIQQINVNRADNSAKQIMTKLFYQQQNAYTRINNLSYGIKFFDDSYQLYSAYATDNYASTQEIELESGVEIKEISLSNLGNTLNFSLGSIQSDSYGSILVGDDQNNFIIEINPEGMINYKRQ